MNKYFTINKEDKVLWLGIAAFGAIFVISFSLFTSTSPFYYLEKFLISLFVIFLPGYVVMKLFFDHITFSENKVVDKFMVSFGLSVATMVTPYFLTTYLRPYVFNTDEEGMATISSSLIAFLLVMLVIGAAFGIKFYQNKKKGVSG